MVQGTTLLSKSAHGLIATWRRSRYQYVPADLILAISSTAKQARDNPRSIPRFSMGQLLQQPREQGRLVDETVWEYIHYNAYRSRYYFSFSFSGIFFSFQFFFWIIRLELVLRKRNLGEGRAKIYTVGRKPCRKLLRYGELLVGYVNHLIHWHQLVPLPQEVT
jgi:hypothetical protein